MHESISNDSLASISEKVRCIQLKKANNNHSKRKQHDKDVGINYNKRESSEDNAWNAILSESVCSKWNAKATPIRSSLR